MNPQAPAAPTPAPLHDIAGPIAFFPYPIWMVVAAGLTALALLALAAWFLFLRRRPAREQSAAERARTALGKLRAEVAVSDPYAFSIAVSDVLRRYLHEARGLSATTQTSREFLETVRAGRAFSEDERAALAGFLEKADLIKFARLAATPEDCTALLDQAERLVRSGAPAPEREGAR